jgi:uncharacterized protein (TIGR02594 family)
MLNTTDQPPWLAAAWSELGQYETAGPRSNPRIRALFADAGHPEITSDETAWCAAFVSACLERSGCASTRSLRARSYLNWGVTLAQPRLGAIAILSRGSDPALGHVGFVAGWTGTTIRLLGGNQGDAVSVATFDRARLLSLRWPAGQTDKPQVPIFDQAFTHVLNMEGGYTDDPADAGGPTNLGITLADYAGARGVTLGPQNRDRLLAGLKQLTKSEARAIYAARYWTPSGAPSLPPPLALFHFDTAVNMGTGTAIRMLQTALDCTVDGEIGPVTIAAATRADPGSTLATYADLRRRRYRTLSTFPRFGRGWLARVEATLARAKALASITPKGSNPMTPTQTVTPAATQPKWWGRSLTIWGAVVAGLAAVLPAVGPAIGVEITPATVHTAADQVGAIAQAVTGLAGTIAAIYGRVRATQPLEQRLLTLKV